MEAIIGLAIDIGKCIPEPLKLQFNYLCCFDNNIQILRDEAQKFKDANVGLQMRVHAAKNDAQVIYPHVKTWLESASQKMLIIDEIENNIPLVQQGRLNLISRYSLSRKAKKTAEDLKDQRDECNKFDQISQDAPPAAMESFRLGPKEKFETRKKIEEVVMEALRDRNVNTIGLCGLGGVGKTTMAERIMDRVKEEKLFDGALKVVVSQQVEIFTIQKNIASQLGMTLDVGELETRAYKIRTRLTDTKHTLVVLDDIWERLKLEDLGIPYKNTFGGCKILFTSRDRRVLEAMDIQNIFGVPILPDNEAWSLFREKTNNCVDREDLRSIAENVAKECKGLPVALIAVGGALRNKTDRQLWEDALLQLRSSNPTDLPGVLEDVYNHLKVSYNYLRNQHARSLFLLCSMFEEDSNINLEILTWYGMGLGMFEELGNLKEARNRIVTLVEMLKDSFLLLDGSSGNCVRMHDVVRDMAIYVASKEQRVGFTINNMDGKSIDWARREEFYKDCSWISISNFKTKLAVELKFPSLRLLRLERGEELSDMLFDDIRGIRVLSMTGIWNKSIPTTTQLLINLKTLLLFNCGIESISVVGELSKLEVLCCRDCKSITTLPLEIGRLNRLRLLEIIDCGNVITTVRDVISNLVSLEEFVLQYDDMWDLPKATESNAIENLALVEFGALTRLSRLEIEINDVNSIAQEINFPPNVEKYRIGKMQDPPYALGQDFSKAMRLEIPKVMNVGKWIKKLLRNTEYLDLEGDGANQVNFAELENVKYLNLQSCSSVKKLVNTFHLLERLVLYNLENLEEIIPAKSNNIDFFRNLWKLDIHDCPRLRYLFPVSTAISGSLSQLEELTVKICEAVEDIFYNVEKDGTRHHHLPMVFPKLKTLVLDELPRLDIVQILPEIVAPGLERLNLKFFENDISSAWCSLSFLNNLVKLTVCGFPGIIKNLMSLSVARNLLCLRKLRISYCERLSEVIADDEEQCMDKISLFPSLTLLKLSYLPELRSFCQWKHDCALEMPSVTSVWISECPKMETFTLGSISTSKLEKIKIDNWDHNEIKDLNDAVQRYIKRKIVAPGLTALGLHDFENDISSAWCSSSFFNNLVELKINNTINKNSMSLSVARNLLCLRELIISYCKRVSEVVADDEEQQMDKISLFPSLTSLHLYSLPELRSFCQWKHDCALEMPSLTSVYISDCPKMETFNLGSVSTPKLERIRIDYYWDPNYRYHNEMKDLNDGVQRYIKHKIVAPGLEALALHDFENDIGIAPGLEALALHDFENDIGRAWCSSSFFNNLVEVSIDTFPGIKKNLMSLSVARNLLCLRELRVRNCERVSQVIADDEEQQVDKISLFPSLTVLYLQALPQLRSFCQWKHDCALEMPSVTSVWISKCHKMETFTLGSLSTPKLEQIEIDDRIRNEIKDLNDAVQCCIKHKDNLLKI